MSDTNEEFKSMTGHIQNSRKLITKYGRRENTDKLLIFLALVFFFATVLYIVKKRLFWCFQIKVFLFVVVVFFFYLGGGGINCYIRCSLFVFNGGFWVWNSTFDYQMKKFPCVKRKKKKNLNWDVVQVKRGGIRGGGLTKIKGLVKPERRSAPTLLRAFWKSEEKITPKRKKKGGCILGKMRADAAFINGCSNANFWL